MIILFLSIVSFNVIAFKCNTVLNVNKIIHIWMFTIAFQFLFDLLIEFKFEGYWYFSKGEIDWLGFLVRTVLVPPVNMMCINFYPLKGKSREKIYYIAFWSAGILIYELVTLLPAPFGYFHYGWWKLGYSAIVDPVLFFILLMYYKLICIIEMKMVLEKNNN
ncbi:hypothetical protein [Paenibacillus sp. P36]|uniref:hypothetical protein n=1 Tax=Paenibacillus sp. P36 TaxID=3342538 RepID=UPI0038B3D759